jgi:parallel beta-helix repeat protein
MKILGKMMRIGCVLVLMAGAAKAGNFLMNDDSVGGTVSNNAKASSLGHTVTEDTLANITTMPVNHLLTYDVIWLNPGITVDYASLQAAVANGGSLEQYADGGGVLVLCVAGIDGNKNSIAPGGVDAQLVNDVSPHNIETFTTLTHPYFTGVGYGGAVLATTDFDDWSKTDHGWLTGSSGQAVSAQLPEAITVLSNSDGPSLIEYDWGCGTVIVNTLTYGWASAGAKLTPQDNLINYADFLPLDSDTDGFSDSCLPTVHNINTGMNYFTIQAAIDVAGAGHVIEADPKIYFENINFAGKAITVRSTSGDPADTIIDGGGDDSVVTCQSNETSTTVLDGFTITNGSGWSSRGGGMYNHSSSPTVTNCVFTGNTTNYGGGMYNHSSSPTVTNCVFTGNTAGNGGGGMENQDSSNPTVTNCTFSGNTSGFDGGGMHNSDSSNPTVTNCTFSGNTAPLGGGMYNTDISNPTVTNCTFSGNTANYFGGGMYNTLASSPTVSSCVFTGNTADVSGGGMYNNISSNPTASNCTFSGNTANYFGGGMYNQEASNPTVSNCTFSGNTANYFGGGMYNTLASSPTVSSCILWGDSPNEIYNDSSTATPTVRYSDIQGGLPSNTVDGGGNIDADPLFVDVDGPDNTTGTADDNLRLSSGSPCIDSGRIFDFNSLFDLGGNDRDVDDPTTINTGSGVLTFLDIGAYEFQVPPCSSLPGDINCDGIVNLLDQALLALHWLETI